MTVAQNVIRFVDSLRTAYPRERILLHSTPYQHVRIRDQVLWIRSDNPRTFDKFTFSIGMEKFEEVYRSYRNGYFAFICGSAEKTLFVPFIEFNAIKNRLSISNSGNNAATGEYKLHITKYNNVESDSPSLANWSSYLMNFPAI